MRYVRVEGNNSNRYEHYPKIAMFILIVAMVFLLSACMGEETGDADERTLPAGASIESEQTGGVSASVQEPAQSETIEVPEYDGEPSVELNGGEPGFAAKEITENTFEKFSSLDKLGRCGEAEACIDEDMMPEGERGSIGMIKPSGWQIEKYDFIDNGGYLYNRCHLVGWQLTGQNEEERNLITGTRYMNTEGMLPYENKVADYLASSGNHVMYRVTPIFKDDELVARGVHMEALSVEDEGKGICFNVYCYNVQPGVEIDYETGESELSEDGQALIDGKAGTEDTGAADDKKDDGDGAVTRSMPAASTEEEMTYILNTNTHKFHYEYCRGVKQMKDKNKKTFHGTRSEAISQGYQPCGMCTP